MNSALEPMITSSQVEALKQECEELCADLQLKHEQLTQYVPAHCDCLQMLAA